MLLLCIFIKLWVFLVFNLPHFDIRVFVFTGKAPGLYSSPFVVIHLIPLSFTFATFSFLVMLYPLHVPRWPPFIGYLLAGEVIQQDVNIILALRNVSGDVRYRSPLHFALQQSILENIRAHWNLLNFSEWTLSLYTDKTSMSFKVLGEMTP